MKVSRTLLQFIVQLFPLRGSHVCRFRVEAKMLSAYVVMHIATILLDFALPVVLLYGPVLYRLYRSWTEAPEFSAAEYHLHQLPFYVLLLIAGFDQDVYHRFYLPSMPLSVLGYSICIILGRTKVKPPFNSIEVQLIQVLVLISLAVSVPLAMFASKSYMRWDWGFGVQELSFYILLLSVVIVGAYLIFQPGQPSQAAEEEESSTEVKGLESPGSGLSKVLKERRLYLDPLLSLEKFAAEVGLPRHVCSRQLQAENAGGFYQLIAEYRIEHARHLLEQDMLNELTIEHVAEACGFNSKASFNRYFKDISGCTPSEYRRKISNTLNV